jgi:hypothetical protein
MTWIRSPLWDGVWMLSGIPIGGILASGVVPISLVLPAFLVVNSAHLISPIAMAWSHGPFRQMMLAKKIKYVIVPLGIVGTCVVLGATVGISFEINPATLGLKVTDPNDYTRPFVLMLVGYFVWNAYHFGMQNYGFLRLYWRSGDPCVAMQWAMITTLFGMIIIPELFHQARLSMFLFGAVLVNHQLVAVGLSSHVWANHYGRSPLWFAIALIAVGGAITWLLLYGLTQVVTTIVGLRAAAGFVHFLYDRWVYKLSDAKVRSTIGRDVFCHERGRRLGV